MSALLVMITATPFILFAFGLAIGSFLNVVIFRYDGERPLFSFKGLGGRSHCMACKAKLKWYDLIPVFSYLFLRGKCRACKARISPQYPLIELLTGAAFLLPALFFYPHYSFPIMYAHPALMASLWIIVIVLMIILAGVDMRLMLIPDETVIGLSLVGLTLVSYQDSFLGAYSALFPQFASPFFNHIAGALFGLTLLGFIVLASRGRAMGMGDVKLAGAMGLIIGFPDIAFALALSFLVGGIFSMGLLTLRFGRGGTTMKTMVPFGPFMVLGFFIHIFYIEKLMAWYFALL